jgi:hypothetical protein
MCLLYAFHLSWPFLFLDMRFTYDTAFFFDAFMAFRHFHPETGVMLHPMLYLCAMC